MSSDLPLLGTAIQQSTISIINRMEVVQSKVEAITIERHNTVPAAILDVLQRIERRTAFLESGNLEDPGNLALQRLMASPSDLSSAIRDMDDIQSYNSPEPSKGIVRNLDNRESYRLCGCQLSRTTQFWMMRLGGVNFSKKETSITRHEPSCRFSNAKGERPEQQTKLSARVQGFRIVLDVALGYSFAWRQGAGGFSISAMMSYSAVVPYTAPHLQLCFILLDTLAAYRRLPAAEKQKARTQVQWLVPSVIEKLRRLYHRRQASPRDVDIHGHNVLHYYVHFIRLRTLHTWEAKALADRRSYRSQDQPS